MHEILEFKRQQIFSPYLITAFQLLNKSKITIFKNRCRKIKSVKHIRGENVKYFGFIDIFAFPDLSEWRIFHLKLISQSWILTRFAIRIPLMKFVVEWEKKPHLTSIA